MKGKELQPLRVRGSMDSEQATPNVINIKTSKEATSPSPVKRDFNELNPDFYTLK